MEGGNTLEILQPRLDLSAESITNIYIYIYTYTQRYIINTREIKQLEPRGGTLQGVREGGTNLLVRGTVQVDIIYRRSQMTHRPGGERSVWGCLADNSRGAPLFKAPGLERHVFFKFSRPVASHRVLREGARRRRARSNAKVCLRTSSMEDATSCISGNPPPQTPPPPISSMASYNENSAFSNMHKRLKDGRDHTDTDSVRRH